MAPERHEATAPVAERGETPADQPHRAADPVAADGPRPDLAGHVLPIASVEKDLALWAAAEVQRESVGNADESGHLSRITQRQRDPLVWSLDGDGRLAAASPEDRNEHHREHLDSAMGHE